MPRDSRHRLHPVVAGPAVDEAEVVLVRVLLLHAVLRELGGEELGPGTHVDLGGRRQHAVEVEEDRRGVEEPGALLRRHGSS